MKFFKSLIYFCPHILPCLPKRIQNKIAASAGLDIDGDLMTICKGNKRYCFFYNGYEDSNHRYVGFEYRGVVSK